MVNFKQNIYVLCLCIIYIIGTPLLVSNAYSATIKSYDKDGHSRIVIESQNKISYKLTTPSTNTYKFKITSDTIEGTSSIDNVTGVKSSVISANSLSIELNSSTNLRHFKVGKKIIIDIMGTGSSPKKIKKSISIISTPKKELKSISAKVPDVTTIKSTSNLPTIHLASDHVIQLTATKTISVGAFTRHNNLWIVVDKEDFLIPPQIRGKQKNLFNAFERVKLPGATAFRTKLPNSDIPLYLYAEGGGLIWRIILTTNADKVKEGQNLEYLPQALSWADTHSERVITINDPDFEDKITIVTTKKVGKPMNMTNEYIELTTMPSYIGLAFLAKTEDVEVSLTSEGAIISRDNGLHISSKEDLPALASGSLQDNLNNPIDNYKSMKRIFRFHEWRLDGIANLQENERLIISRSSGKAPETRIDDLVTLARLEVSNGRASEAIGFIELITDLYPDIVKSTEFIALQGAAHALSGQHDLAFSSFIDESLNEYGEISLWKAFSLAGLEDWNQAGEFLPPDVGLVSLYPPILQQMLSLVLAEIALRKGRIRDAETLLSLVGDNRETLSPSQIATLEYLLGEAARQNGETENAYKHWNGLAKSKDNLYRTKSSLALTRMLYDDKKIDAAATIDRLERLRYAWRGDDLETQINYRLGLAYLDNKEYIKGLTIMRNAASRSPDRHLAQEIAEKMSESFNHIFTTDIINTIDPIDTITLYEEFSELTPTGEQKNILVENMAERLIEIDLLGRASTLLKNQIDNSVSGIDGARLALRLASIQLTDKKPNLTLKSLGKATNFISGKTISDIGSITRIQNSIGLLKARAYSQLDQPDNALVTLSRLNQNKQTLQMRADVAWRAGRWQSASDALEELVNRDNINLNRPLSDEQRDMILNWAVTLNLSDNSYILNSLRDRFGDAMKLTSKGNEFEVITRPRKNIFLADRKTIESVISEVDIFKGFLDNYKVGSY